MPKTILITGSTDGIGLETAKVLYSQGHHILLHGRSDTKLKASAKALSELSGDGRVESYLADLSHMTDVDSLSEAITANHEQLDVVINNAGVFRTTDTFTDDGLDIRFAVNLEALAGRAKISDQLNAYAQSKLALTMWSRTIADSQKENGLIVVAVNPGSLLGTKTLTEDFGIAGNDIRIGSDILFRAALSEEFAEASGLYFDNDKGRFASPHRDALDQKKTERIVRVIETVLAKITREKVNH